MIKPRVLIPYFIVILAVCVTQLEAAPGGAQSMGPKSTTRGAQNHQPQHSPQYGETQTRGFGEMGFGSHEARSVRLHRALDSDGSGMVILDEFLARSTMTMSAQFDRMDADGDQQLSLEEFTAARENTHVTMGVDFDALHACVAEHAEVDSDWMDPAARFDEVDSDANDFIDPDEFANARTFHATDRFNELDVDGDAELSHAELAGAIRDMHERRAIHRYCIEEQSDIADLLDN